MEGLKSGNDEVHKLRELKYRTQEPECEPKYDEADSPTPGSRTSTAYTRTPTSHYPPPAPHFHSRTHPPPTRCPAHESTRSHDHVKTRATSRNVPPRPTMRPRLLPWLVPFP